MTKNNKIDLYKIFKEEYRALQKPLLIQTSPAKYLSLKGIGKPESEVFQQAIGTLYSAAFTTKMIHKKTGEDYAVCKLECIWKTKNGLLFKQAKPDETYYQLKIRTPDFITSSQVKKSLETLTKKGKTPWVDQVTLEKLNHGTCVQMLHVGPYENESSTFEKMLQFAKQQNLKPKNEHHEIYISDPRRVEPSKLKTILRIPVE